MPAQLMGAASADIPAIMLDRADRLKPRSFEDATRCRHRSVALRGRAARRAHDARPSSTSSRQRRRLASAHCNEMGTASTMAALVEALGMCAARGPRRFRPSMQRASARPRPPAPRRRARPARACGRPRSSPRPRSTTRSRVLMAIGGGTNAVHPPARAGRPGRCSADARPLRRASPHGRRCSRTCGHQATICSRTSTAQAASRRSCGSSSRSSRRRADGHGSAARRRATRRRGADRDVIAIARIPLGPTAVSRSCVAASRPTGQ